ncbi:MAG: hypothetical protein P8X93_05250 [Gammaproteobacteria bacterium]
MLDFITNNNVLPVAAEQTTGTKLRLVVSGEVPAANPQSAHKGGLQARLALTRAKTSD